MYYSETLTVAQAAKMYIPVHPEISLSLATTEETVATFDDLFIPYDEDDDEDYCCDECWAKQEEENTMSYDTLKFRDTAEGKRVEYLEERASTLFYTKDEALQKQFGLRDDEYPSTPEELVKRIQDGKFLIQQKASNALCYSNSPLSRLQFRDPALKRDDVGYKTAHQKLQALLGDTRDAIIIKSADEGLAAVKAFEAATIQ